MSGRQTRGKTDESASGARALEAAERAEAELRFNQLVAGILAHDLKNPLAAVIMNARLLRNLDGPREQKIAARILASGERMTRMIDQIFDWTRFRSEAGHVRVTRAEHDLGAIVEEVVGELRLGRAGASISVETRGSLRGSWDADRIAQVVSNLVGNGLDHAKRPGVAVRLEGEGEIVRLVVENEGEIEAALWPVMFEPLRGRAVGATARGRGLGLGLGLGLYLTRQIVLAHRGQIEAARAPGGRIVFTVTLPRDAAA